ncbi:DUF4142 domain-containing protein [Pontibacter chitinilyticus]|uniref:DUF4142 domain-containing protein n=1 Tax=Pontibacter chitinilyticus TaxID=2674989 RepID=UPI00321AE24A
MPGNKLLTYTCGVLLLCLFSCHEATDYEAEATVISETRTLKDDPAFWDYAASSNMLQTALGQLAIEKGTTEQVRQLGEQSVKFHVRALKRLRALMRKQKRIQLPDSLGGADQGLVKEFQALEGTAFDEQYRTFLITSHTTQLERYQEAVGKADDQRTQAWLLDMENHLRKQLQQLATPPDTTTAL